MNIEHAIEMIDFGLNWKDTPSRKFDFIIPTVGCSAAPCGTRGCFAGWFAFCKGQNETHSALDFCSRYIGVGREERTDLFMNSAVCWHNHVDHINDEKGMHMMAKNMMKWLEKETGETYAALKEKYNTEHGSWEELEKIWKPELVTEWERYEVFNMRW